MFDPYFFLTERLIHSLFAVSSWKLSQPATSTRGTPDKLHRLFVGVLWRFGSEVSTKRKCFQVWEEQCWGTATIDTQSLVIPQSWLHPKKASNCDGTDKFWALILQQRSSKGGETIRKPFRFRWGPTSRLTEISCTQPTYAFNGLLMCQFSAMRFPFPFDQGTWQWQGDLQDFVKRDDLTYTPAITLKGAVRELDVMTQVFYRKIYKKIIFQRTAWTICAALKCCAQQISLSMDLQIHKIVLTIYLMLLLLFFVLTGFQYWDIWTPNVAMGNL